jgi:hypothetical protein
VSEIEPAGSAVKRAELSCEQAWNVVKELHRKNFLTDNALVLSGETLIPLKYGTYRDVDAVYLVTNDLGGYNQAKQLAKEIAVRGAVADERAKGFSFQVPAADEKTVRIQVMLEERLCLTAEVFRGVPALDERSLLEQNILYHKEKGSDQERNARAVVDLIALSGAVAPELAAEAIRAVNTLSAGKTREIGDLVKAAELDKALETVGGITPGAKESLRQQYKKMQVGERSAGITD